MAGWEGQPHGWPVRTGAHCPPRVYVTLRPHRDVRHIPDSANRHHFQGLTDENGYRHHLFWTSQAPCHYGQPNHSNALLRVSRLDIAQRDPCCCTHFFSSSLMYSGPLLSLVPVPALPSLRVQIAKRSELHSFKVMPPSWKRTGGCGRTASAKSKPACSSSTRPFWFSCSGGRKQVLIDARVALH